MKSLFLAALLFILGCASKPIEEHRTVIPFTLHDNRILIPVIINEKGPFTFVFDTGGARAHTMTPETAKALGLSTSKGKYASGAGESKVESHEAKVDSYKIGDLTHGQQKFDILDLSSIQKAFGFDRLDGIVGFDVLKRPIICIDYEEQILILKSTNPNCFGTEATVIPFRLDHDTPVIKGTINGIETEFIIDTGDRSAFSLFQKFATKNKLDEMFKNKPEVISGVGVGGKIPAKMNSLKELTLGPQLKIENILTRLPTTKSGYFAKSTLGGSIGNEVLRRFNVILDYSKNEISLVKNRQFNEKYEFKSPLTQ